VSMSLESNGCDFRTFIMWERTGYGVGNLLLWCKKLKGIMSESNSYMALKSNGNYL
jgi:hypothetical protein